MLREGATDVKNHTNSQVKQRPRAPCAVVAGKKSFVKRCGRVLDRVGEKVIN